MSDMFNATICLPNGQTVPEQTLWAIRALLKASPEAMQELVMKAQNHAHAIIPADYCKMLAAYGLIKPDGSVYANVVKVIEACYQDHGPAIVWLPPVK